jgi:uncharacterized protein with gpF-like domain
MAIICLPRFDQSNPAAVAWAENEAARLVREITEETRTDISAAVSTALDSGQSPAILADVLIDMIGLLPRDQLAVARRMAHLIDEGFTEVKAARMAQRYAARLLKRRAMTIARTETARAANIGVRQGWQQAMWDGYLSSDAMRVWIGTDDARIREEHAWLAGFLDAPAQVVRVDQPFRRRDGTPIEPGEDINCRCSMGIAPQDDIDAWAEWENEEE